MRLPNLSVTQRVTAVFVLMIALVLIASGTGLFFNQSFGSAIDSGSAALDEINAAASLENAWFQVVGSVDYMLLTRQTTLIVGRLSEQLLTFNERMDALQTISNTHVNATDNAQTITTMTELVDDLNETVDVLFNLALRGSWARAQAERHTEMASLQRRFTEALTDLQTSIRADATAVTAGSLMLQRVTQRGWVVLSLLAIVIGGAAAFLTARSIIRPVNSLAATARAIQNGDFSQRAAVTGGHELGVMAQAFNSMTDQLGQSIHTLESNVSELVDSNAERDRLIKELEGALLFKDQFLATMSHELRTPLNAILGYAAIILQEDSQDDDTRYMMTRIEGNSTRLLNLINDVLNISRINANRVELVARPIDVKKMVQAWFNDYRHQATDKNLTFEYTIDPALPNTIIGDEERITQISANLLQNAFKFTGEGGVHLNVVRDDERWQIVVSDSGQGIPETWQHMIFDEFRQVDSGSRRKHGGAGLGLSIVKKLCLLMGGSVTVQSKLDSGSTFTVTLPLKLQIAPDPSRQDSQILIKSQLGALNAQEEREHVSIATAS
ncbi:MAG: HAMP domain-containing sensor histidine kinase [Chloroflexota bacterium]|nr:HAMP domain-containing sensor histidine kinase [Chloroflexota bacterium]